MSPEDAEIRNSSGASAAGGNASSSIERRVRIGFALGFLVLVFVGGMSYRSVARMRADVEWVDHTHQVISALREFRAAISVAETNHRAFVFSGDQSFLGPYNAALQDVDRRSV